MRREQRDAEFAAFVDARQRHYRRLAYAICGDWTQAEDLLQIALMKLYVAWPRVRRDGREDAYVRQILVRANIDEHRRPWRREFAVDQLPESGDGGFDVSERGSLIQALQELPLMQRKTVILRHWLNLTVEETAAELGISTGTVKSHSSRAIERLQHLLTREGS